MAWYPLVPDSFALVRNWTATLRSLARCPSSQSTAFVFVGAQPMNHPMEGRPRPARPAVDLFDMPPIEPEELAPSDTSSSLPWRRLALAYFGALGCALLFRFPTWASLALPFAALAAQSVRGLRWPYRVASAAVFSAYVAQISSISVSPAGWGFRFASTLVFLVVIAWGMQVDDL